MAQSFSSPELQVKRANRGTSAKPLSVLSDDNLTAPTMTTKTITVFVDHSSERTQLVFYLQ